LSEKLKGLILKNLCLFTIISLYPLCSPSGWHWHIDYYKDINDPTSRTFDDIKLNDLHVTFQERSDGEDYDPETKTAKLFVGRFEK